MEKLLQRMWRQQGALANPLMILVDPRYDQFDGGCLYIKTKPVADGSRRHSEDDGGSGRLASPISAIALGQATTYEFLVLLAPGNSLVLRAEDGSYRVCLQFRLHIR